MALEIDCHKDIGFIVDEKKLLQAEPGQMDPTAMVSESPMPCFVGGSPARGDSYAISGLSVYEYEGPRDHFWHLHLGGGSTATASWRLCSRFLANT